MFTRKCTLQIACLQIIFQKFVFQFIIVINKVFKISFIFKIKLFEINILELTLLAKKMKRFMIEDTKLDFH